MQKFGSITVFKVKILGTCIIGADYNKTENTSLDNVWAHFKFLIASKAPCTVCY